MNLHTPFLTLFLSPRAFVMFRKASLTLSPSAVRRTRSGTLRLRFPRWTCSTRPRRLSPLPLGARQTGGRSKHEHLNFVCNFSKKLSIGKVTLFSLKGTRDAAAIIFPNAFLAMCAQHLKSRALLISIGCESAFRDCVKPFTMSEFQRNFNKLKSDFPAVHQYLLEKELKRWARSHMTHLRTFGLMTNNLAEQHKKLMKYSGRTG